MIRHISTVAIYVEDQERSLDYYTHKLRFEVRRKESMGPGGDWIEVAPPGAESRLIIYPRSMMRNWEELKPSIVFFSEDVEVTYRDLVEKGVQFEDEPKEMAWGTFAKFADPDGNEFLVSTPVG